MLIAAGVVAIGAGGYFYVQNQSATSASILEQIPADTAVLAAQMTPIPLEHYLASISELPSQDELMVMIETDPANITSKEKFFYAFYDAFLKATQSPEQFKATFGTADMLNNYAYTLGIVPVLKMEVANPAAFWSTIDQLEADSEFTHIAGNIGKTNYRRYPIVEENGQTELEFIIGITDGFATFTVNIDRLKDANPLEMALGLKKPAHSVASSNILEQVQTKYSQMADQQISYIDHQQLATGFTTQDGNLIAKQLTKLSAEEPTNPFAEMQTLECQNDIQSIAANWPRTIAGGSFQATGAVTGNVVIESNNNVILSALKSLRGFIPQSQNVKNSALFVGMGIDINQLTPAVTQILTDLQSVQYQCQPLAEFQQQLTQANPAMMVGMASGFVNGLKGISFTLFDYQMAMGDYAEELTQLDAAITVSADNPSALVQNAAMMMPELASIQLPSDGTPVALPEEFSGMVGEVGTVYAATKGQHLTIYTGEKSGEFSSELMDKPLEKNGITNILIDYKKLFSPVITMMEQAGEPVPEELEPFINNELRGSLAYDVTDNGITFDVENIVNQ